MNLDHLRVFYVAATKKNFSETAKALHLSQPSVSLQIQQLEESLHVKLFDRTTRTIRLTAPGEILKRYAERIIQLVSDAEKELTVLTNSIHGELSLGASTTIGEHILPYLLGHFKLDYPNVNLLMKIGNSQSIIEQIENREIDIGFVEAPFAHPMLHMQPFYEDELVVVCSRKHPPSLLIGKDTLTPQDLYALPLILRESGSGTRQVINNSLLQFDMDPGQLHIVMELGNTEAVKAAVETGMGISILSKTAIRKELTLRTLRKLKLKGISLRRFFYIVYDRNQMLSPAAYTFTDYLLKKYNT